MAKSIEQSINGISRLIVSDKSIGSLRGKQKLAVVGQKWLNRKDQLTNDDRTIEFWVVDHKRCWKIEGYKSMAHWRL